MLESNLYALCFILGPHFVPMSIFLGANVHIVVATDTLQIPTFCDEHASRILEGSTCCLSSAYPAVGAHYLLGHDVTYSQ